MKLGFVGLGKMGGNMVRRLLADGHEVVAWARGAEAIQEAVSYGAVGATSLQDIVPRLSPPRCGCPSARSVPCIATCRSRRSARARETTSSPAAYPDTR